jgi:hypothetical protein
LAAPNTCIPLTALASLDSPHPSVGRAPDPLRPSPATAVAPISIIASKAAVRAFCRFRRILSPDSLHPSQSPVASVSISSRESPAACAYIHPPRESSNGVVVLLLPPMVGSCEPCRRRPTKPKRVSPPEPPIIPPAAAAKSFGSSCHRTSACRCRSASTASCQVPLLFSLFSMHSVRC